jgi:hypothetical protein
MLVLFLYVVSLSAAYNYDFADDSILTFNIQNESIELSTVNSIPADCNHIQTPPLLNLSPIQTSYSNANGGQAFGTSTGTNAIINFSIHQYLQLSDFGTSQINFYRKLQFYPAPSNLNSSYINVVSISECPGDFTQSATCLATVAGAGFSQIKITTDPNADENEYCKIEPGASYYMNIIHDQFPFDTQEGRCAFTTNQTCAIFFNELSDTP